MGPITTTIIGEIVAAGAGWYIDSRNTNGRLKKAQEYLLSGINDDLQNSVAISKAIKYEWQQKERVEHTTLNKLKRCALTYRHNQELIPLVYQHEHGEQIFKYFHEIIEIVAAMEHDQGCLDEIETAFNDKLLDLKEHTPSISAEAAVSAITSALTQEQKQYYNGLRQGMSTSINRLTELTHTAATLDKELQ